MNPAGCGTSPFWRADCPRYAGKDLSAASGRRNTAPTVCVGRPPVPFMGRPRPLQAGCGNGLLRRAGVCPPYAEKDVSVFAGVLV